MIEKFHKAKVENLSEVVLWGDGSPYREFLYVDDLADACIYLMRLCDETKVINVGAGEDLTIKDLSNIIRRVVKYDGEIVWDITKPNGTPRKLLDTSFINSFGWYPRTTLSEGINKTYEWYVTRE
jgi:GDP-L-fucose synthase